MPTRKTRSFSGINAQGNVLKSRETQRDPEKTSEPLLKCRFHFTGFGWIPCSVKARECALSHPPGNPRPALSARTAYFRQVWGQRSRNLPGTRLSKFCLKPQHQDSLKGHPRGRDADSGSCSGRTCSGSCRGDPVKGSVV